MDLETSPGSETTTSQTTSDESSNPLDDRLHALTQSRWRDSEELPPIRGVRLIKEGPDTGLYQISVRSEDGSLLPLGHSNGIEKASEIHDMVALGIHGRAALLNFSPRKFHIDAYLNVLLTFQKLFPANQFWTAVKHGIDAGVRVDAQSVRTNPILNTFFSFAASRPKAFPESTWIPRPVARWPPFCPPWLLSPSKRDNELTPPFDATATLLGVCSSDLKEPFLTEEKLRVRKRRVYHVPRHGVVTHRVLHPFAPPRPILYAPLCEDSEAARKTRRGRSVKQPVRYREDTQLCFSDSDSLDARPSLQKAAKRETLTATPFERPSSNIAAIPVLKTPASAHPMTSELRMGQPLAPVFCSAPLQCYTPLRRNMPHLC